MEIKAKTNKWNLIKDFPGGSDGKVSAYNAEDLGSIPGSGRSPGEGNGNPLQYSCLENSKDGVACYSPWGRKESDTTERLHSLHSLFFRPIKFETHVQLQHIIIKKTYTETYINPERLTD